MLELVPEPVLVPVLVPVQVPVLGPEQAQALVLVPVLGLALEPHSQRQLIN